MDSLRVLSAPRVVPASLQTVHLSSEFYCSVLSEAQIYTKGGRVFSLKPMTSESRRGC